jgi:hypothetical protein
MFVPVKEAKIAPSFIVGAIGLASIVATRVDASIAKIDHSGNKLIFIVIVVNNK